MTKCVLPLYERLREKPTFVTDVVQVGREEEAQQFVKEFLQPEVVRWSRDAVGGVPAAHQPWPRHGHGLTGT